MTASPPAGDATSRPSAASAAAEAASWALAVSAGLTFVAAHPPIGWWPMSFASPVLLLSALLLSGPRTTGWRTFGLGTVAGVAAFAPMLTWIVLPAGVLGWSLLVVIQGAFWGLLALVLRPWVTSPWIVAVAPLAWVGMDAWRARIPLGGFGWGELAYAHVEGSWLLPLARLAGGRAVTLVAVLLAVLVFDAIRRGRAAVSGLEGPPADRVRAGLPHAQPALVGLAATLIVSALATIEPPAPDGRTVDVLVVQGNDLQEGVASSRAEDRAILANQLELTRRSLRDDGPADLVVWPESSIDRDPFSPRGAELAPLVQEAAALTDGRLLAGVNLDGPRAGTFRNTAAVFDADGEIAGRYVKRHLVPFGEYVPFRRVLGDLPPLRQVPRDALPGPAEQVVDVGGVRLAVAICFETLFPNLLRANLRAGDEPAGLIVVTTNDASFGDTAEPAQHLAQSRLRAVELGRWVVHGALSGRSAFVAPNGTVHQDTEVFTATTIRRELSLITAPTPYLRIGDVVGWVGRVVAAVLLVAIPVMRRRRSSPPQERP